MSTRFPARAPQDTWAATRRSREDLLVRFGAAPFVPEQRATRAKARRATGLGLALDWLEDQEGGTWQQRWLASGAEEARASWREVPTSWLVARGDRSRWHSGALVESVPVLIAADAIRPSLGWLVDGGAGRGSGVFVRAMAAARDPEGFSALGAVCDADPSISATARSLVVYRSAQIMATKGGGLADVCVGDVLELLDALTEVHHPRNLGGVLLYRLLAQLGIFGPDAPATLRALRIGGQRSPEELIDRYDLVCRPVRDLLVDYLRERQPALDYVSLGQLAYHLAKLFWSDLERHHPGIDSLRLSPEVADAWKRRLRTRSKMVTAPTGERVTLSVERVSYQSCLTPVRAFYLDLAHWALEDPKRWGAWVAPCPISDEEVSPKKYLRQRKSRLDARTRERLPVLPVLQRRLAEHHKAALALLEAARRVAPGEAFEAAGVRLVRRVLDRRHGPRALWADDPCSGERRELVLEEEHAFWAWAIVEVLRATGVRIEELLELSHHSLVQYRLPSTGEIVPLLQIMPSKTDTERLLVVNPELAEVLSAIIMRVSGGTGIVPLVAAYDHHEKLWSQPKPLLFQRRVKDENRAISYSVVRKVLDAALTNSGLVDRDGMPLRFTPHDFRRIMITDAVMNGLPPHIAQVIAGHQDLNVTMAYKAVYPEEIIEAHLAFLARRRALRPSEEYRTPTDEEWHEFLGNFERRKVSIGTCARAFFTPCIHEHACIRCPMLWPDPAQRARIQEISDNLTARIEEARREGWLGEVDGLEVSLAGAKDKLAQIDRHTGTQAVELLPAKHSQTALS